MISLFVWLWKFILSLWDVFGTLLSYLVFVIRLLGDLIVRLPSWFIWLPNELTSMVMLSVVIVIIYKILDRS